MLQQELLVRVAVPEVVVLVDKLQVQELLVKEMLVELVLVVEILEQVVEEALELLLFH
jgi:phage pi2 protein 07